MKITNEAARDFLVNYQYLDCNSGLEGSEGVKTFMQRVRCIQYDPLNVVGRNADLVLQSRIKNYKPEELTGAIIWLASDASHYANGTDILIDALYTAV